MKKYILYILCCVSLVTGLYGGPGKKTWEAQCMSEVGDIHFCTQTYSTISVRSSGDSSGCNKELGRELSDEKFCEFLPGDSLICRTGVLPLKVLKSDAAFAACRFCLSDTRTSIRGRRSDLFADSYSKYSNKYYVYTLGHILI